MDDVLVASRNKKEHRQATHELLEILAANDLFLKPEKCVWEQPRVDYLGLILEEGVTRMCHGRVGALKFLSYLRTRDPERILSHKDRGTFVF